jgi:hypothetical protein
MAASPIAANDAALVEANTMINGSGRQSRAACAFCWDRRGAGAGPCLLRAFKNAFGTGQQHSSIGVQGCVTIGATAGTFAAGGAGAEADGEGGTEGCIADGTFTVGGGAARLTVLLARSFFIV